MNSLAKSTKRKKYIPSEIEPKWPFDPSSTQGNLRASKKYQPELIEDKWQKKWQEDGLHAFKPDSKKKKYYNLVELPYPSGDLHLGHWFAFAPADAHARYKKMYGYNVFFPNGFDSFGLPAENAAIKRSIHPKDWTMQNIETMRGQFDTMGTMIDWSHEAITCLPDYYRWNQWIFIKMFEKGLAYRGKALANWCPTDQTVLANENIENGKCWRCGSEVIQKEVEQWFLKITDYADKLLWDNTDKELSNGVTWPKQVREGQNNWIGKSDGALIEFPLKNDYNYILLHGFGGTPNGNFFPWVKKKLEELGVSVQVPALPNSDNPTEEEQVSFVLKNFKFDERTILFGHSLGSVVAMKVVEKLDKKIAGLVLSGTFAEAKFLDHSRPFEKTFNWKFDSKKIRDNVGFVTVLHDTSDDAVPLQQAEKVASMFSAPIIKVKANSPHFDSREEPSILKALAPSLEVFTTRPDTLYGATFMVVSPEHPIVQGLIDPKNKELASKNPQVEEVRTYAELASKKTELERKESKEKSGVFTGLIAVNPVNRQDLPIYVADYVLSTYGTGAIMAVPAHDDRDFEFAKKYNLPIKPVIRPNFKQDLVDQGNEQLLKEIFKKAKVDNRRVIIQGGWILEAEFGDRIRNHSDIDFFVPFEDVKYWKDYFVDKGFKQEKLDSKKDDRYFVEFSKEDKEKGYRWWVDIAGIGIEPDGALWTKDEGKQTYWDFKEKDIVKKGKLFEFDIEYLSPKYKIHSIYWCRKNVPVEEGKDYSKYEVDLALLGESPYVGEGIIINSSDWNGLKVPEEIGKVINWLEEKGLAQKKTEYHLHDWSISRQRYWGTPVPMIHCPDCGTVPVPLKDLPVELPYEVDYTPKGKPPLATDEKWLNIKCPECGGPAKRDAETLDTFFDSAWYYYRYTDPKFEKAPFDEELVKKVLPVDIYFGGAEHTLGHTLYARFFTKFFKDLGLIDFDEFAKKRVQHGVILGPDGYRMSKSRGNVVNPDDVVKLYGADTVRLYLCFMMPYEATSPWDPGAITGVFRFLKRIWDLSDKIQNSEFRIQNLNNQDLYQMHKTIKKVGEDLEQIKFNTAVASLMEWLNHLSRKDVISLIEYKTLILLLAPFAPHIAEELWQEFNPVIAIPSPTREKQSQDRHVADSPRDDKRFDSIHLQLWPSYDKKYLSQDTVTIVVQVNGKVRDSLQIPSGQASDQKQVEQLAKERENVKKYLEGKEIKKVIYIEGKLISFVV